MLLNELKNTSTIIRLEFIILYEYGKHFLDELLFKGMQLSNNNAMAYIYIYIYLRVYL